MSLSKLWFRPLLPDSNFGRRAARVIAFGLGSGLLPRAPGTWGTLIAVPLYWILIQHVPFIYSVGINVAFTVFAVVISEVATWDLEGHDDPRIVIDEMVGIGWVVLFLSENWIHVLLAVIVFRLFDIIKPWPIKWLEAQWSGGIGIVADDIMAAFLTIGFLKVSQFLLFVLN